ncbi:MAG: CRISPR-associated endonuclease Cas1 [Bacteroidota bacterium]
MQLVLDTKGVKLAKKSGVFHVAVDEEKVRVISPQKLKSIAITANATLTADAVRLAIQHEIPILFFDRIGKAKARLWSPYFQSIATLRRNQVRFSDTPEATNWMLDLFRLKTMGQVENLRFLRKQRGLLSGALGKAVSNISGINHNFELYEGKLVVETRQGIMGTEGSIARIYWQAVGAALPQRYRFRERSRQPAKDIFNASLNYLYGMLYSVVEGGLFAAGLDPHLGLFHTDEYRKPTLSFDLIEPFRPWVDRLLIDQCVERKLEVDFFTQNQYGLFLNKKGKAFIIPLFNEFLRGSRTYINQESTVKNHIYFMAGRLATRIRSVME